MSTVFRNALLAVVIILLHGIGNPDFSSAGSWPATDGYPYYGQTIPFHWIEISTTGTAVTLSDGDEGYTGPLSIGFPFPFYNTTPTTFYVSANGYISFDANNQEPVNQCPLPDADAPNNLIALMWGDLTTNNPTHSVYYKNHPTCPVGSGKCLVVEYVGFNFFSGEKAGTFEAILYETGEIIIQFLDVGPNAGKQTTTGIENNNAGANHGLTFACNTANSLAKNLAIQFKRIFLAITPEDLTIRGCNGQTQKNTFTLENYTGIPGTFDLSYNVTTGNASLTGPGNVVANPTSAFEVTLIPDPCLPPGTKISATITAQGNNFTSTAVINQTVYQTGFWDDIAAELEFCRNDIVAGAYDGKIWSITGKGASNVRTYHPVTRTWSTVPISNPSNLSLDNWARSGCQHGSKVYFYGDTVDANFKGLWAFNMATNEVSQVSTGGPLSQNVFGPAWAYDPDKELCYLTGGAESSVGNSRGTVHVYAPNSNSWSTLPPMTTSRKLHAAFVFTSPPPDNRKLLCVAGGMNTLNGQGTPLSTTQCYDLNGGPWYDQNANLGHLPGSWWGMGYAQRQVPDSQLWLVAGVINGLLSDTTQWFNVNSGTWSYGGNLVSGPVYRNSAVTLDDKVFKLGGLVGLTQTCSADENLQCTAGCKWWSDQLFLPLILK